MNYKSMSFS